MWVASSGFELGARATYHDVASLLGLHTQADQTGTTQDCCQIPYGTDYLLLLIRRSLKVLCFSELEGESFVNAGISSG